MAKTKKPHAQASTHPLVGKYGLGFKADGSVHQQFYISSCTAQGRYLIQLYDWIVGAPGPCILIDESWFVENRAQFFAEAEDWQYEGRIQVRRTENRMALEGGESIVLDDAETEH